MNHSQIVSFIWGVVDLIRDTLKRGKYQDVILPLTVLRRLDCVLALTKRTGAGGPGEVQGQARQPRPAAPACLREPARLGSSAGWSTRLLATGRLISRMKSSVSSDRLPTVSQPWPARGRGLEPVRPRPIPAVANGFARSPQGQQSPRRSARLVGPSWPVVLGRRVPVSAVLDRLEASHAHSVSPLYLPSVSKKEPPQFRQRVTLQPPAFVDSHGL